VSPAAPYRHFADKQALLAAICQEGFTLFNAALRSAYESGRTPRARLEEMGVAYVRFALDHPGYFRVMFGRETGSVTVGTEPEGFLLLAEAIASLAPRAAAARRRDLTLSAWSLVHGFAFLQLEGAFKVIGEMNDVEQQLRRLLRSFMHGQT
jgi:AcrR family transcriptional regulator